MKSAVLCVSRDLGVLLRYKDCWSETDRHSTSILQSMATYYSGPRVRLPSNRSLQLSDISSSSASSHAHSPASQTPVLIFPAPPSEPGSPYAHGRNSVRRHTRIDWSGRGESVSRVRVDSDASSGSLITGSGWSEVGWPLTHERVVRVGSARMMPSRSESVEVEMWEWTSSGSVASRGEDGETNYEDALSQIEFAALESRREIVPRHAALEQRVVRLPFRFLLELLGIDGATLMLVERGSHAPESISETGLFGAASSEVEVEVEESGAERRVLLELGATGMGMVKRGLDALAEPVFLPPLKAICLVAWIPRRVWAGLGMPRWRG